MKSNGSAEKNNARVPAVDRAVRILQVFQNSDETLGVSELARRLNLNKSTLHSILNTLAYYNLLERDETTKTYRLGQGLYVLGSRARPRTDLYTVAHPYLVELARAVSETVLLGVFREEHVFILDREEAPHDLKISARIGQRMPFNAGVFGYIFNAALPAAQLAELIHARGLRSFTPGSMTRLPAYRKVLAQVRERGYAVEREQFLEGVSAVAAPVVNASGQVAGVLCIVGLSARLPQTRLEELADRVQAVAAEISRALGAETWPAWNGVVENES